MTSNKQNNHHQIQQENNEKITSKPTSSSTSNNKLKSSTSPMNTQLKMMPPPTITQQQLNQPLPALPGNVNNPWEIYFDPNYTFFGGTILDSRKHKQQYEILQAMAAQDCYLHLHPPFIPTATSSSSITLSSSLTSSSSLLNHQPSLPTEIMNSVDDQMLQPKSTNNHKDKNKMIPSSSSDNVQSSQPMMDEKEHYARLKLLKVIRAETYHDPTFPSSTFNADHHPLVMLHKNEDASSNEQPPLLRNIKTHTISYQHRQRYRHLQQRASSFHQSSSSSFIINDHPYHHGTSLDQSLRHSKKHIKRLEKQDKKTKANNNPIDYFYSLSFSSNNNESDDTIKNDVLKLEDEKQVPLSHPPLPLHQHHLNTASSNNKHHSTTTSSIRITNQLFFFLFLFGFICPPLWLIGAFYTRSEHKYQSSEDRNMDLKWKKYSKVALGLFLFILLILLVILLLFNPGALGWRQSDHDQHADEKFVSVQSSKST